MKPKVHEYGVQAICPDCGVASYFDWHDTDRRELGWVINDEIHKFGNQTYSRIHWRLLRCSGCNRGGLAKFHDAGRLPATLETFYPRALQRAPLPTGVPEGVAREYREAERCASAETWRAASALLRSTLEKALKANGYKSGTLEAKIDNAASDGVITAARSQKAHDDVRVLGNEVVHDDWREITEDEVQNSLHYVQRVLEDLYDDRPTVEGLLKQKGRLPTA